MALSLEAFRQRIEHFRMVWRSQASGQEFGGMSYAEFEAGTADSLAIREEILRLETRLAGLRTARDLADRGSARLLERLASGVRGEPAFGEDSPFYKALGYIPASERKTGRTRRRRKSSAEEA